MISEPSPHTFVHISGDWLLFDDPRAALDHLFPGASNHAELMIAVAQSAQHAELDHWERVHRRNGTASMTVEDLAIYMAPKGERFERDLPERWRSESRPCTSQSCNCTARPYRWVRQSGWGRASGRCS